jgi:hypothetical protein
MAEYRPLAPQDCEQYRRFVSYGFAAERGPLETPDDQYFETELFEPRGVYDGGLVSGCKRYDIEADVRDGVELRRSTESWLLDLVDDPDDSTCERVPGPMVRLTSLEPLGDLDWGVLGLDRPVTLAVTDPLLAENDGLLRVSAGGVEETSDDDPDVRTDIGTLTQLYVGRYDSDTAERVAGLTLLTDSVREPLAAVFPRRQVCLREFF